MESADAKGRIQSRLLRWVLGCREAAVFLCGDASSYHPSLRMEELNKRWVTSQWWHFCLHKCRKRYNAIGSLRPHISLCSWAIIYILLTSDSKPLFKYIHLVGSHRNLLEGRMLLPPPPHPYHYFIAEWTVAQKRRSTFQVHVVNKFWRQNSDLHVHRTHFYALHNAMHLNTFPRFNIKIIGEIDMNMLARWEVILFPM